MSLSPRSPDPIVITGLGVYCSVARDVSEFHDALLSSRKGFRRITEFDVEGCRNDLAAKLDDVEESATPTGMRGSLLLRRAVREALGDASLPELDGTRVGVTIGTSLGGIAGYVDWAARSDFDQSRLSDETDTEAFTSALNPHNKLRGHQCVLGIPANLLAYEIARAHGFSAGTASCVTACSAGANSLAIAMDFLRTRRADVMVAAAVDALTPLTFMGFHSLMALTKTEPSPFDRDRGGLLLGEGAGALILERKSDAVRRGARIYAEVAGYGLSNDAYHVTQPHPDGLGAILAMRQALEDAEVGPDAVGYINMHGTGTKYNDAMELRAMATVFGDRAAHLPISSIKSALGHTLGAAGTIEAIATVLAIHHRFLPANLNMSRPIDGMSYEVVREPRIDTELDIAMSNSFAFGGNCVSLVFRRAA